MQADQLKALMASIGAGDLASRVTSEMTDTLMHALLHTAAPDYLYDSFCSEFYKDYKESNLKKIKASYNGTAGDSYMGWANPTMRSIFEERPAFMNKLCKYCKRNVTPCGGSGIMVGNILSQYQVGSSLCMFYRQSTHLTMAKSKLLHPSSSQQQDCLPLASSSFEAGDCVLGAACCQRWGLTKNERRLQERDNNSSNNKQQINNTTTTNKSDDNGCESRHCRFCSPEVVVNKDGVEELHYATFNPTSLAIPLSADVSTVVSKHVQNIRRWVREPLLAEIEDDSAPINEGRGFIIICNEDADNYDDGSATATSSSCVTNAPVVPKNKEHDAENFEKEYGFKKDGERLYIGGRVVYPILSRFAPPPAPISLEVAWVIAKAAFQELIAPTGQKKPAFFQKSVLDIVAKEKADTPETFHRFTVLSKHKPTLKMVCASNATKIIRMSFRITRPLLLSPFLLLGLPQIVEIPPPEEPPLPMEEYNVKNEECCNIVRDDENNINNASPTDEENKVAQLEACAESGQPNDDSPAEVAAAIVKKKKKKKQLQQDKEDKEEGPPSYRRKPGVLGDGSAATVAPVAIPERIKVLVPLVASPTTSNVDELPRGVGKADDDERAATPIITTSKTKMSQDSESKVDETVPKTAKDPTVVLAAVLKPSGSKSKVVAAVSKGATEQATTTPTPAAAEHNSAGDVHTLATKVTVVEQQQQPQGATHDQVNVATLTTAMPSQQQPTVNTPDAVSTLQPQSMYDALKVETEEARIDKDEILEEIAEVPLTEDIRIEVKDEEEVITGTSEGEVSDEEEEDMEDENYSSSMTTVPTDPSVVDDNDEELEEEEEEKVDDCVPMNRVMEKVTELPTYIPPPQQKKKQSVATNIVPITSKAVKKNGKLVTTTNDVITPHVVTPSSKSGSKPQPSGTTTIKPTSTTFTIPVPRSKLVGGTTTTVTKPTPPVPETKKTQVMTKETTTTLPVPKTKAALGTPAASGAKSSTSSSVPLSFKDTFVKAIGGSTTTTTNTIPATTTTVTARTAASVVAGHHKATPTHLLPSLSTPTTIPKKASSVWGAAPSYSSATSDSTQTSTIGHVVRPNVSLLSPPQQQQQVVGQQGVKGATPPYTAPVVVQQIGGGVGGGNAAIQLQEVQQQQPEEDEEAPVRTAPPPIVEGSLAPATDWSSARQRRRERRRVLQHNIPVSSEMMIEREQDMQPPGNGGNDSSTNHQCYYEEEFVGFGGGQPSGNYQQQFNPFDSIPTSAPAPPYNNAWNVTSSSSVPAAPPPPAYKEQYQPNNNNNSNHPPHHYQQHQLAYPTTTTTQASTPSYADAFIDRRYDDDDDDSIDFDIPIDIDDLVD